ncbi:MAG TPA: EamA family transporter [Bacillales bacterium]|nr:EamA family transporter [Bacillales bacterium]
MEKKSNHRIIGFAMVLCGSTLWGLSGTVAQRLFEEGGFQAGWLVTMRLLVSGALLLLALAPKINIFQIWRSKRDGLQLVLFGIIGMLAVQYTYFAAIETGNAATATLLQYLGPAMITVYLALRLKQFPKPREIIAVFLALAGTFFLVTNGSLQDLTISPAAVTWGLASAAALAFYTLYPENLLKKWGAALVVGWGMLIGGAGLSLVFPPWQTSGQHWSGMTFGFVAFVIVFGTLVAFFLYLESLKYIKPTETSLLACAEPLTAAIAAIVWLHVPFGIYQVVGGLCILATVVLLSLKKERKQIQDDR